MSLARAANLVLRVVMECGVVAGLAYWGVHVGQTTATELALGIGAPLIGFGIWGAVDFRNAVPHAEILRLIEELVISGVAALGLASAGQAGWGIALVIVSLLHHLLVYALGERLLAPSNVPAAEL